MRHTTDHHAHHGHTATGKEAWLIATWPFVRDQLPPPPASVIELGCGPLGGHVPSLLRAGYHAIGVDPEAPQAPGAYRRIAFEDYRPDAPVDAVIASVSLHHTRDPGAALDHVADLLVPGGTLVVIEWISEELDERTAQWCFRHRPRGPEDPNDPDDPGSWLAQMHADWTASGLAWDDYFRARLEEHGMHPAATIRRELEARFATTHLSTGPYYFSDLLDADEQAEQAAIDSGHINPGCLRYSGQNPAALSRTKGGARPGPPLPARRRTRAFPQLNALIESGLVEEWADHVRRNGGPFPKFFVDWVDAEKSAATLFYWAPILVPDLLQVESYARAILATEPADNESPDALLAGSMGRQQILSRPQPPAVTVVMAEAVLHCGVGGPAVMHEQLTYLAEVSQRPKVMIQVIPAEIGAHAGLAGAVSIADREGGPAVVYLESFTAGQTTGAPDIVARVRQMSDMLRCEALPRGAARDLIMKVAEQRWTT